MRGVLEETADRTESVPGLQIGDARAWEELYRQLYPKLFAYASRRLATTDDARDAVSEAMARSVAGLDRMVRSGATPEAWIFGILRHVVLDLQRKSYRQRRPKLSREVTEPEPIETIVVEEEGLSMRAAFARLPERDRDILELRVVAGLGSEEAAKVLGMRPGALRTAQTRALHRLRALLSEVEETHP
jgi:RNA polymerase sigma-70 factor (ECF subfamily)